MQDYINEFEKEFKEYFDLFLEEYPLSSKHISSQMKADSEGSRVSDAVSPLLWESHPIFEKSISCQTLSAMCGKQFLSRLNYLGLAKILAFDNSVDWYTWYHDVKDSDVQQTVYVSIYFRISSELKRMKFAQENDGLEKYLDSIEDEYLVSFKKYDFFKENPNDMKLSSDDSKVTNNIHISKTENNYYEKVKSNLADQTTIASNSMNILSHVIKLMFGKI